LLFDTAVFRGFKEFNSNVTISSCIQVTRKDHWPGTNANGRSPQIWLSATGLL